MFKRILTAVLLCSILLMIASSALAHDSQEKHDEDLWNVLYGETSGFPRLLSQKDSYNGLTDKQIRFYVIADAAAICIDQFSSNETAHNKEQNVYKRLNNKVSYSFKFDDIDLNITKSLNDKNITATTHRSYTHQGWNFSEYPNKEFWKLRKQVLQKAVKYVLADGNTNFFSWFPAISELVYGDVVPETQSEAFCVLIYYVHILGDHEEGTDKSQLTSMIPISCSEDKDRPGIIAEIENAMEDLFPDQRWSFNYTGLLQELDSIASKANKNYYSTGCINTSEKCQLNITYAKQTIEILSFYIPNMLKKEEGFKEALY